jgi:hypothetical protein
MLSFKVISRILGEGKKAERSQAALISPVSLAAKAVPEQKSISARADCVDVDATVFRKGTQVAK